MTQTQDLSPLEQHATEVMAHTGFQVESTLQFGTWYDGNPRSLVYSGLYQGRSAVMKIYHETKPINQPENLLLFTKSHTSQLMHAPELYAYEVESPHAGWMIMERVPAQAQMLHSPISLAQQRIFLETFFEYRSHMPLLSPQAMIEMDQQPIKDGQLISGAEFHLSRIDRWKKMADQADAESVKNGIEPLLTETLQRDLQAALQMIEAVFSNQPLYWCHGHIKPNEIHIDQATGHFWMTDFGHMAFFPRGYEYAFMIWADVLMEFGGEHVNAAAIAMQEDSSRQRIQAQAEQGVISYAAYRQRVRDWITAYNTESARWVNRSEQASLSDDVRQALVLEKDVQMAALLERILGTIYADTIARVEIPYEQKQERVALLQELLHEILNDTLLDL